MHDIYVSEKSQKMCLYGVSIMKLGRKSCNIAASIRDRISSGDIAVGDFLPTVRELETKLGVSRETGRRALKLLEREGLITAEARAGYRVLAKANDPNKGLPIAFVVTTPASSGSWDRFRQMLMAGMQRAAAECGWSLLAVEAADRPTRDIVEQLRVCRACGIVLDTMHEDLIAAVSRLDMPAVMMDAWPVNLSLDSVVQDGFQGALSAAQFLVSRGHERIAWLGPIAESSQSKERFGGAVAGIASAGLELVPRFLCDTPRGKALEQARALLAVPDRPTGVLALWHECAAAVAQAAAERGLKPGRDLEFVGWTPQEQYDSVYRSLFNGAPLPPTMVWSVAELTRIAVARLAQRRANPKATPTLTKIPVSLAVDRETGKVENV